MSLLDDALKRQEELNRAAGKAAGGQAPRVTPSVPPSAEKTKVPRPPVVPPPKNPFLEREKNLPRNAPNFFMPFLAVLVLIALIYLRCEFSGKHDRPPTETELDLMELADAPVAEVEPVESLSAAVTNDVPVVADDTVATNSPLPEVAAEPSVTNEVASGAPVVLAVSTDIVDKAECEVENAPEWPLFTLTGIAVGRERLAILDTGEMLVSGEIARCGAKIMNVSTSSVTFAWQGETKTLRKGERSDKVALP